MNAWSVAKSHTGTGLLRQFATLSALVIGLISFGMALVVSHYLRKDLLEREWRFTADYIRAEALYRLSPEDFSAPMAKKAQENFRLLYRQARMMPEIVRVKIYDGAMAVLWSDEPRLIGQRFPDNPTLVGALTGRTAVNLETDHKGENIYERNKAGHLVEVYVPITFPGTDRVAGVVETYKLPEKLFANIRRSRLIVAGDALVGGALLYLSLFWIVRRAARRIESQRHLTAHLQTEREDERTRVAREIHDDLGQALAALKIDLGWWAARLPKEPPVLREMAQRILAQMDTTIHAAQRMFTDLRPPILDDLGLAAALEWETQRFQTRTGIQCEFTCSQDALSLDPVLSTVLFRISQEALTNVARHAQATRAVICLERQAEGLLLTVKDNGKGITEREIADQRSIGLVDMRERVLHLNGQVSVLGVPGRGTTLRVRLPLPRAPRRTAA